MLNIFKKKFDNKELSRKFGNYSNGKVKLNISSAYYEDVHECFDLTMKVVVAGKKIIEGNDYLEENRSKFYNWLEMNYPNSKWVEVQR